MCYFSYMLKILGILFIPLLLLTGCSDPAKLENPEIDNFQYQLKYISESTAQVQYEIQGSVDFVSAGPIMYELRVKIGRTQYHYRVQRIDTIYQQGTINFYGTIYIDKNIRSNTFYRISVEDADGMISNILEGRIDLDMAYKPI